jgi:hypothetical protein
MLVEEGAHLAFGQRAHEAVHGLAAMSSTQVGMLRMPNMPASCCSWSESILASLKRPAYSTSSFSSTGPSVLQAAPGRPEVHQHGHGHRGGNHLGFKILYGDVDHGQSGRQGPFKGKFALFWPKPATGCAGDAK